jgi:hypothetical protein
MVSWFKSRAIEARLAGIEERLERIERGLAGLESSAALRAELETKREQLDALSRQGLHVVELLGEAREEIERLKGGGGK